MKKDEFRTPLLQSAVVIIVLLVLLSFVVTSGADGLWGGLAAITSGIVYSILFTIGLIVSIFLSISLLILLFLAAIALYSFDKAKDIFVQLQTALLRFTDYLVQIIANRKNNCLCLTSHEKLKIEQLEEQLAQATEQNRQLRLTIDNLTREIDSLRAMVKTSSVDEHSLAAP